MNDAQIRKYAELMKELGLTGLELTEDNVRLRLERTVTEVVRELPLPHAEPAAEAIEAPAPRDDIPVRSPIVGVFYAAPSDNAQPFVAIGDRVTRGQTLCIVEAMKLMNEVAAEESGVITEICVTNGQVVEYGTELFRIRRSA